MTRTNYYLFRAPVARVLILVLATVVASLSVFPVTGYAQTSSPQPYECVVDYLQQGIPLQQAMAECDFEEAATPGGTGVGSYFDLGGGLSTGTTVGSPECRSGYVDPQISSGQLKEYQEENNNREVSFLEWLRENWSTLAELWESTPPPEDWEEPQMEEPQNSSLSEYERLIEEDDTLKKDSVEPWWKKLENLWKSVNGALSGSRIDPNAEDACQQAAEFFADCNANGWTSGPCQLTLARMKGCSDPTVTDPVPESARSGDKEGQDTCNEPQANPKEVERVVGLVCSMKAKPVPGQEDPCAPLRLDTTLLMRYVPHKDNDGNTTPCGDPRALPGQDQCVRSITVAKFGAKSIEDIVRIGQEKLGGPGYVPPRPNPVPPGPGPQPETGEPGYTPPAYQEPVHTLPVVEPPPEEEVPSGVDQAVQEGAETAKESAQQGAQGGEQVAREGAPAAESVATGVPIKGYDNLNVGAIVKQLDNLSTEELKRVRAYEQENKNRDGLIGQIDRRINAAS